MKPAAPVSRRHLLHLLGGLPLLTAPFARNGLAAAAGPIPNPSKDPYQHTNRRAKLPPWPGGDSSDSPPGQMWMFRGNAEHNFTGSGPLGNNLVLKWKFRMWDYATQKHGEPIVWQGTGWTGQSLKVGNYVYIGSTGGHFHCFEALTGKLVWVYTAERMFKGSPCYYKGKIYAPNVDNRLRCLDAETGKLVWQWSSPNDIDSSPLIVQGKLYIGGEDGAVKCFDPDTGKLLWRVPFGVGEGEKPGSGGIESSLAVSGGIAYFGHLDGNIRALRLADQRLLWTHNIGKDVDASPLVVGDKLYIGAEEGEPTFHCLSTKDGSRVWSYHIPKGVWSSAAHVAGRIFVGGHDGAMHCLDAATGKLVWRHALPMATWFSPVVLDGKVLFGSYDRWLRLVDANSGELLWKYDLGGRCHSAAAVADGHVWVGSASGWYFCFGPAK